MSTPDIRRSIVKAFEATGWTRNRLAAEVEGKISRSLVYAYIDGTNDMTSEKVNHLLGALGLKIVPSR